MSGTQTNSNNDDWDSAPDLSSSISDEDEEISQSDKFKVDFEYESDSNTNPILLIPTFDQAKKKRPYFKIDYD